MGEKTAGSTECFRFVFPVGQVLMGQRFTLCQHEAIDQQQDVLLLIYHLVFRVPVHALTTIIHPVIAHYGKAGSFGVA